MKIIPNSSFEFPNQGFAMDNKEGYVYILTSPNTNLIKIGGSDYPPSKRIKEINSTEPYRSLGPWSLADFRQIDDWRNVERNLHYAFKSKLNFEIGNQKELFHGSLRETSIYLDSIDPALIINKPKIDRMFQDNRFTEYIINLFIFADMMNWLNIQGAWTFTLFPSTSGGRYFTINIGSHEVAFSTLSKYSLAHQNMILVDRLIFDFDEVVNWIEDHNGIIKDDHYSTALSRSASILFEGSFSDANEFLLLDGVRRALIAYWNEALIRMKENEKISTYAKHHNWNAVALILQRIELLNRLIQREKHK